MAACFKPQHRCGIVGDLIVVTPELPGCRIKVRNRVVFTGRCTLLNTGE